MQQLKDEASNLDYVYMCYKSLRKYKIHEK